MFPTQKQIFSGFITVALTVAELVFLLNLTALPYILKTFFAYFKLPLIIITNLKSVVNGVLVK